MELYNFRSCLGKALNFHKIKGVHKHSTVFKTMKNTLIGNCHLLRINSSLKKSFLIQSTLKLLLDESHHALASFSAGKNLFPEVEYILSPHILFSHYHSL